jgi:hypothetical protein
MSEKRQHLQQIPSVVSNGLQRSEKLALVALYLQKKEGGRCGLLKAEQNNH